MYAANSTQGASASHLRDCLAPQFIGRLPPRGGGGIGLCVLRIVRHAPGHIVRLSIGRKMSSGSVEGILQVTDERQDGHLRDPNHPLRPARGNFLVSKQVIREMHLRPGLLLRGLPRGRMLDRIESIEGRPPDEYIEKTALYDATALDP